MAKQNQPKAHASLKTISFDSLIKHPLVRLMACGMAVYDDSGIREIYDLLGYFVSDRNEEMKYLLSRDIIYEVSRTSYYYSYTNYAVTPAALYSILSAMTADEVEEYLNISKKLSPSTYEAYGIGQDVRGSFVRALFGCLHHSMDIDIYLRQCMPLFNEGFNSLNSYYSRIMMNVMLTPEMHSLVNKCTKVAASRFVQIYIDALCDMRSIYFPEKSCGVFFDENNNVRANIMAVDAITFVVNTELMVRGRIDDIIAKYTPTDEKNINTDTRLFLSFIKAVKSLHEKDPKPMLTVIAQLIDDAGTDILSLPPIGFFAMVAVVMINDKKITAEYTKYLKTLDKYDALIARGVIEWLTKGQIGPTLTKRIVDSAYDPATKMLFSFFTIYLGIGNVNSVLNTTAIESKALVRRDVFKYLNLIYLGIDDTAQRALEAAETSTAMRPLFQTEKQEPWEKFLDKIGMQLNVQSASTSKSSSGARVAYLISNYEIQPILQKSSNGLTWSKGRNIALKTFMSGTVDGMTSQDMKLIPAISVYSGWGGDSYSIDYRSGLYALAGHPYLYTDDASRLKVEITEIFPQLSVTTTRTGSFKLVTNINPDSADNSGIYIDTQNPLSITVMKLSSSQLKLLKTLGDSVTLPKEAKTRLTEILGSLSSQMTVMSDLVSAKDSDVKRVKGWSKIVAQLVPANEMVDVSLYVKPLKDTPPYLNPGEGAEFVNGNFKGKPVQARRNLKEEKINLQTVHDMLRGLDNSLIGEHSWELDIEHTLSLLASIAENAEVACVEWPEGAKMTVNRPTINPSALSVNIKSSNNWFEIEGDLRIDDKTMLTMAQLLQKLRESNGRFIRLEGNEYLALSEHLAKTLKAISRIADTSGKSIGMSAMNVDFIEDLEKSGAEFKADESYRNLIARIEEADTAKIKMPKGIQADLRDYQKEGYQWLQRLSMWGAGACLADDMGLGKTLQTICLLYANRKKGASLVVAPTSVLLNWRDEIARFAPSLNVSVLNDFHDSEKRASIIKEAKEGDVVITSYGLLVNEQEHLSARKWNVITLDEAHTIKNRDTKMSQAAMTLTGDMRVALTGTPLQNRLAEIWNIFQFINPGLLGSFQSFTDRFILPIERDADRNRQRLLKRILSPFMLRRTKSDVLSELPEKTEITVRVELSAEERALYEHLRQEAQIAVEEGDNSAILALAEITRLRQAACNPKLVQPNINIESSKLRTFMEIVESLHSNHHRALVFSQFTSHLALVRKKLDAEGVDYLYLDGSTPPQERARLVQQFQNSDIPLFLISLKAGGLGLNLTAADYVVHLDPWWNPAIEDQASDRSHRIGQQKPVTVYRLIAANTIEEKILRLHSQKKSLADALLEGSDMSARLTRDEILALLSEK